MEDKKIEYEMDLFTKIIELQQTVIDELNVIEVNQTSIRLVVHCLISMVSLISGLMNDETKENIFSKSGKKINEEIIDNIMEGDLEEVIRLQTEHFGISSKKGFKIYA